MNVIKARTKGSFATNGRLLSTLFVWLFLFVISGCATTGKAQPQIKSEVQREEVKPEVQGEEVKPGIQEGCSSHIDAKGECSIAGVIAITENYQVDPQIENDFSMAVGLLKEKKYPDAIKLLESVVGRTDKFTAPYINLGIAYARTGEMEKAEENLKKALAINNRHPVALNELGLVYRKTGRYREAREVYESTLDMYPDFLPTRKNLGVLCDIYLQDLGCALSQYEDYLKSVPEDKKMKIWIADVKSRMN